MKIIVVIPNKYLQQSLK